MWQRQQYVLFGEPMVDASLKEIPETVGEWEERRKSARSKLWSLLGDLPPRPKPDVEIISREYRRNFIIEKFQFDNGAGAIVPGYLIFPARNFKVPAPAIHYYHYHGGQYHLGKDEVLERNCRKRIKASELTEEGYIVLIIDTYCFGDRQGKGPAGRKEKGRAEELSLSKYNLWLGRTLWGMMLRDELIALDYLLSRPDVDSNRIGAMGMSMGSTKTWWIAALDERIKVCICVAGLTRYQNLITAGNLDRHSIYYYVPGVLKHFDTEVIVSLIAPRPILALTGSEDIGSPADGVKIINDYTEKIFALYEARGKFRSILYSNVGHVFTSDMWDEALAWFKRWL